MVKVKETKLKGGGVNLDITCPECGKPITVSNKYGMFCKDRCMEAQAKKEYKEIDKLVNKFVKDWDKEEKAEKKRKKKGK
jgi:endogenous inhibitor of DNA gyrase (YacG/DUF329 family)